MYSMNVAVPGNLGSNAGAGADGVLAGYLAPTNPDRVILESHALAGDCITDDGGAYVNDTTDFGDVGADDVAPLPATPAVDDACYFGHSSKTFGRLDVNITTQGVGTWTITWEYWNGTAWTALSGVTDGTTGFTAATGWVSVTFTVPTDWAKNTVDSVNDYWVRANVSAYTSITTQPLLGQGYVIVIAGSANWTDETADAIEATGADVTLLPAYGVVGDALYVGVTAENFCKVEVNVDTAQAGTMTFAYEYWDGTSWTAFTVVNDDSAGFSTGTSTYLIHFQPPTDWVANTTANGPNSRAGFFMRVRLATVTTYTTAPVGAQIWVYPLKTGADGIALPAGNVTLTMAAMNALTASAANADSIFLLVNISSGAFAAFTWTQADQVDDATIALAFTPNQKLALVQIQEDGTTEFADASFAFSD